MKFKIILLNLFILVFILLNTNIVESGWYNRSNGFGVTEGEGIGTVNPRGITTNGTDLFITSTFPRHVYRTSLTGTNLTGFSLDNLGIGGATVKGITTNGTSLFIVDGAGGDQWVYHASMNGTNYTSANGGQGFSTDDLGCANPAGITTNGSDFWIVDNLDLWTYHTDASGTNITDGFPTNVSNGGFASRGVPFGITTNGSDFLIGDYNDDWMYHVNKSGYNFTDGFDTTQFGFDTVFGITTLSLLNKDSFTDIYSIDGADDFVSHLSYDILPSNVTITTPSSSQSYSQTNMDIDITYTIVDNYEVKKVYYKLISDAGLCVDNATLDDSITRDTNSYTNTSSITLCAYGTYELFIYADDYAGNINSTESVNFTVFEPPEEESTKGGAISGEEPPPPIAGSVSTSTVQAITQPIQDIKTYTDTQKAVLYSEINEFITEYSEDYTSEQLSILKQSLQEEGIILTQDLLKLWINSYLASETTKIKISGGDVLKYLLKVVDVEVAKITSYPPLAYRKAIEGYVFDQYFSPFSEDTKWVMILNISKPIVKCNIIKGPEQLNCLFLDNQTIKFEYNYVDKELSKTEIFKIVLLDKDLSTIYVEGNLRIFNLNYKILGIRLLYISIIVIFIIAIIFIKKKQKVKN